MALLTCNIVTLAKMLRRCCFWDQRHQRLRRRLVRRKIYLGGAIVLSIVVVVACILGSAMLRNGSKTTTGSRASQILAASFKATPTVGTPPLAVHFTDTSTGSPTSWTWDFGDGTTASGRNPSHIYREIGKY